jgi:hypothetical protein
MTIDQQINIYNQVHENKFYIIKQDSYSDLLLHPDLKNSIKINHKTDLKIIIQLLAIYQQLSKEQQEQANVTAENIVLEASYADTETLTELAPAADGYVDLSHTRYQTLRHVTVKLKNNIVMTCDSSKPITIKLHNKKQCPKEDVSEVLAQLEKETQLQADDIHYGAY